MIQIYRHNRPTGVWKLYHEINHQCCLILPQPSGSPLQTPYIDFKEESKNYIRNICEKVWYDSPVPKSECPTLATISFPGLNKHKIYSKTEIPGGPYRDMSLKSALQSFRLAKISSLILSSNDGKWLFKLPPYAAVKEFFKVIEYLYDGTNFEVLFISTMFPRREFYSCKGELKMGDLDGFYKSGVKEFNDALLSVKGMKDFEIRIKNREGKRVVLKQRVVDMTKILEYDQMYNINMYCARSGDGKHIKGVYSQRCLEQIYSAVKEYRHPYKRRQCKKGEKARG